MADRLRTSFVILLCFSFLAQQIFPSSLWAQQVSVETVSIPDVTGLPVDKALSALKKAGVQGTARLGGRTRGKAKPFTVYQQKPTAGKKVTKGSQVEILIYTAEGAKEKQANDQQGELSVVQCRPFLNAVEETVDPRTNLLMQEVGDLLVPAGPVDLEVRRTLQVASLPYGYVGSRWRMNWEKRIRVSKQVAIIDEGPGLVAFGAMKEPTNVYRSFSGETLELRDEFVLRRRNDRSTEYFDGDGRLIAVDYGNKNKAVLKYDSKGRLTRIDGPFASWLEFKTDAKGRVIQVTGSNGSVVRYAYQASSDQPENVNDGLSIKYSYDAQGRLAVMSHPQTGKTKYTYEARNRITSRTWADGSSEQYEYDDKKGEWARTDPDGSVTKTFWRDDRRGVTIVSPSGHGTVLEYDKAGRITASRGATRRIARFVYDDLGRVTAVSDSVRGTTLLEYKGDSHRLARVIDHNGDYEEFRYDEQGNFAGSRKNRAEGDASGLTYRPDGLVRSIRDEQGDEISFDYDQRGNVVRITDQAGRSQKYDYNEQSRLVSETDPSGGTSRYKYDAHGRLVSSTDALEATTSYEYDNSGRLKKVIEADGSETKLAYDARGRVVSQTDALGRVTKFGYSQNGEIAGIEDAAGRSEFQYDLMGNPAVYINPLGGIRGWIYDVDGNVTSEVSPTEGSREYQYSAAGMLIGATDATGTSERIEYDSRGSLAKHIDVDGQATSYEYDDDDRLLKVVPPYGRPLSFQYDEKDNLIKVTEGNRSVVKYTYDKTGRRTSEESSTGRVITYRYDELDQVVAVQDNLGNSRTIQRDALGRPNQLVDADGEKIRFRYNAVGDLVSVVDPLGHEMKLSYNAVGEMTETSDPAGNRVEVEYDAAGRIAALKQPGGGTLRYEYNALGNPTRITSPDDKSITRTYDNHGRLLTQTDAKGQTTRLTYNELGQLARTEFADGKQVRYEYDKQGRLILADDGKFPVRRKYDERGNLSELSYPAIKRTLRYEYDNENRLAKFINSEGRELKYTFDQEHRLAEIREGDRVTRFTYDKAGRRSSVVFPNGVRRLWKYGAQGRLVGLVYLNDKFETITGWKHTYDAAGNLIETTDTSENKIIYGYDAAGQLTAETPSDGGRIGYTYGPGGNRVSRNEGDKETRYEYNLADQLLSTGDTKYEYDANGNLVTRNDEQGVTRFHYDAQDQLVKVELPGGETVEYGYSPTGERIWRRDSAGLVYYVTDGLNVLAELNEDLTRRTTFTHAPGIDRPIEMSRGDNRHYLLADHLGSIRSVVDKQGKAVATLDYDAFGTITQKTGKVESPFTYTSRELDPKTKLYYYRARYYDSRDGRFLTRDPVDGSPANPLSMNEYLYTENNPLAATDPLGTSPKPWMSWGFGWNGPTELDHFRAYVKVLVDDIDEAKATLTSVFESKYIKSQSSSSLFWTSSDPIFENGKVGDQMIRTQLSGYKNQLDHLDDVLSKAPPGFSPNDPLPSLPGREGLMDRFRQQRLAREAADKARAAATRARMADPRFQTLPAAATGSASPGAGTSPAASPAASSVSGRSSSSILSRVRSSMSSARTRISSLAPKTPSFLSSLGSKMSGGMGSMWTLGKRGLSAGLGIFIKAIPYYLAADFIMSGDKPRWLVHLGISFAVGAGIVKGIGLSGLTVMGITIPVSVLAIAGAVAAGWIFDSLWPAETLINQKKTPPSPKVAGSEWIPQPTHSDEFDKDVQFRRRAKELLGQRGRSFAQMRDDEFRRRAKAAAAAANNSDEEKIRQRAGLENERLTEEDRRRQEAFDAYNRALEAERLRHIQQQRMQQWIRQQQIIPRQQRNPWPGYQPRDWGDAPKNLQA